MLIRVHYNEGSFDYVSRWQLDQLIEAGRISGFMRAGGWVKIGVDPIRKGLRSTRGAHDRRRG